MKSSQVRLRCAFVILLVAILFGLLAPYRASAGNAAYVEGEAIVLLRNGGSSKLSSASVSGASVQGYAAGVASSAGGRVLKTYGALSEASDKVFAHIKSDSESTNELISRLEKDTNVLSAMPNYIGRITDITPNDPRYGDLWGMAAINAPAAWGNETGKDTVFVAVIDTGVSFDHEDLEDNIDEVNSKSFVDGIASAADDNGHGTHVSGTIGAIGNNSKGVVGVNWEVKIIAVKIAGADGSLTTADELEGVNYVTKLIRDRVNIKAVNMSYGAWLPKDAGEPGTAYYAAYKLLSDTDKAVLVVAAGNDGHEVGAPNPEEFKLGDESVPKGYYCYPQSFALDNMIVAGAINNSSGAAYFSNWSSALVDVVAPGVDIMSTWLNGAGYALDSGTSMAAPHVAGAAALVAAKNSSWTAARIKNALLYTADVNVNPIYGITFKDSIRNTAKMSAYGLIDVSKAINYKQDSYVPVESVPSIEVDGQRFDTSKPITIKKGQSKTLLAAVSPPNATDQRIKWISDNPRVAYVTGGGVLVTAAAGYTTLKAYPLRGSVTASVNGGGVLAAELMKITVVVTEDSGGDGRISSSGGGGCAAGAGGAAALFVCFAVLARTRKR